MPDENKVQVLSATAAGRYRLRIDSLVDRPDKAAELQGQLEDLQLVAAVSANPLTGTLLLRTHGANALEEIVATLKELLGVRASEPHEPPRRPSPPAPQRPPHLEQSSARRLQPPRQS